MSDDKLAKVLGRIRKLLDRAEHPNTPAPEAESSRAMAERLMDEYRVQEEAVLARDPQAMKPVAVVMEISKSSSPFYSQYYALFARIATHVGVRYRYFWQGTGAEHTLCVRVVGYEADIRMAELLFTSARMVFSEHLEPAVKPELGDAVNVYRLRRAGIERWRIAQKLWGSNPKDGAAHGKVAKIYKAECERRGEDAAVSGRQISAKTYRQVYAKTFVQELDARLRRARDASDRMGGLPALHGRKERVAEAFYELYPEERPSATIAERKPCEACKKTKHSSGQCKAHRPVEWTAADEARWQRLNNSPSALSGAVAGASAAQQVKLDGSSTERLDRYSETERDDTRQIWEAIGGSNK